MKKPRIPILALITCVFAAFLGGFFAGRNINRTPVQITTLTATVPAGDAAEAATEPGILDINTATAEELQGLPGIGEVLAQRIIDYRDENGPFQAVGDLLNVSGIGTKKLEAILDLITIGG